MNERTWERMGAGSGLVAAVLLLVSLLLHPAAPTAEEPVLTFFYIAANRGTVLLTALLATLAGVVFLWFVGHLRHLLQRAEGGVEAFSPVVFAAGVGLSTVTVVSMLPVAALASMTRNVAIASQSTVFVLAELHRFSLGPLGLLVALFAATAGAAMVRREMLAPWVGWFGFVVALIGLVAGVSSFYLSGQFVVVAGLVTGIAFAVWVGDAAVLMLYRPEVDRVQARGAAFAH
ncbi:hypothetical protein [Saccharopolyspora phatthalungensis]|uniref:Uncharacterized protein n=1 Tax=Saccharopolyspora phatthalungensis TaxID=664693 RepID=A0A840QEV1_9PSEU|nr:hypothetical protein [Saccharopolyspora phatthalungensis]MBB5158551.1 hypothetical protein [Saccharopolyspora phatthalungensis]